MSKIKMPSLNRRHVLWAGAALLAAPGVMTRPAFAVTPAEMGAIEVYMLKEVGVSYGRIRGCTLVAEESPLNQGISAIFAPASIEDAAEGNS